MPAGTFSKGIEKATLPGRHATAGRNTGMDDYNEKGKKNWNWNNHFLIDTIYNL